MEDLRHSNISVYGPVTGSAPSWFYLPEDNILQISLYIKKPDGEWIGLVNDTDFICDFGSGMITISTSDFTTGSTIYATFNYSATRAITTPGNSITDTRACLGSAEGYFYVVRAVDRVGHFDSQPVIVGKQTVHGDSGWDLVCDPFIQKPTDISRVLDGIDWDMARTWFIGTPIGHWTVNIPGRPAWMNTLTHVSETDGIWVRSSVPANYTTCGRIMNITYDLRAGWNLVSFPYFEFRTISDTLAGLPWDRVEIFDPAAPYLLTETSDGDLAPGRGFWVHLTSDAVWNSLNY
jgi:hypothetical protein